MSTRRHRRAISDTTPRCGTVRRDPASDLGFLLLPEPMHGGEVEPLQRPVEIVTVQGNRRGIVGEIIALETGTRACRPPHAPATRLQCAGRDKRKARRHVAGGADFATAMAPTSPDPLADGGCAVRYCAHNPIFTGSASRGHSVSELLSGNTRRRRAAGMERGDLCPRAFIIGRVVLLSASRHDVVTRRVGARRSPEHCHHYCIESAGTAAC